MPPGKRGGEKRKSEKRKNEKTKNGKAEKRKTEKRKNEKRKSGKTKSGKAEKRKAVNVNPTDSDLSVVILVSGFRGFPWAGERWIVSQEGKRILKLPALHSDPRIWQSSSKERFHAPDQTGLKHFPKLLQLFVFINRWSEATSTTIDHYSSL